MLFLKCVYYLEIKSKTTLKIERDFDQYRKLTGPLLTTDQYHVLYT